MLPHMTENNLYDQLVNMTKPRDASFSVASSSNDQSQVVDPFKLLMDEVRRNLRQITDNYQQLKKRDKLTQSRSADDQKQILAIAENTELNSQRIKMVEKLLKEISTLIDVARKEQPDQPETMSKIYQKNFLLKEVQKIMKQAQKIQVLQDDIKQDDRLKQLKNSIAENSLMMKEILVNHPEQINDSIQSNLSSIKNYVENLGDSSEEELDNVTSI